MRNKSGLDSLRDFRLQKTGAGFKPFQAQVLLSFRAHNGDVNLRLAQISADLAGNNRDVFHARVLHFRQNRHGDGFPNRFLNFFRSS